MLTSAGALTLPRPMLFISHVDKRIDRNGELVDPDTLERPGELVAALESGPTSSLRSEPDRSTPP